MKQNLADYLMVGEAAAFLGVSASTLRNWDRMGKVKARRHPVNGYRLYLRSDLAKLLAEVGRSTSSKKRRLQRGGRARR